MNITSVLNYIHWLDSDIKLYVISNGGKVPGTADIMLAAHIHNWKKNAYFQLEVNESIEVILQSPKRAPLLSKTWFAKCKHKHI